VTAAASQSGADEAPAIATAAQAPDLPEDPSPSNLPFTGFQLLMMAMVGLAALAAGSLLRRGARHRRAGRTAARAG
jgi:hypothetical protein